MTLAPRVVLGVDQARASGWAVHALGRIVASGVARNAADRRAAVELALAQAGAPRELLVVLEDHGKMPLARLAHYDTESGEGPKRNAAAIVGMGDARGRWREQLELVGVPLSHFVLVEPGVWRRAVFGRGAPALGTDAAKALALRWASQALGRVLEQHDEAEAAALASWGAREGVLTFQARLHEAQARGRASRSAARRVGEAMELALPAGEPRGGHDERRNEAERAAERVEPR